MTLTVAVIWHCAVLAVFTWISGCAAQYTYDVYPVHTCPASENCLTLSDIVNEREKYFTSNVTLVFHPGDHSLQGGAVSVANVSNLTLQGSTTRSSSGAPVTKIVCDNSSLSFSGVSDLHIVSINFVSCRNVLSFTVSVFQDCSFENSTAVNSFSGIATFAIHHVHSGIGGAVFAEEGNTLNFSGISNFEGNTAYDGGAVYAFANNTLSFSGNSSFDRNTATYGGALSAGLNNTLSFSGNSNFEGNTATYYGGALYARENNTLSFSGNSNFEGNTATYYGGALYARENNTLSFSGNSNFEGNTADYGGGALFVNETNTLSVSGNSSFEGNEASYGGALYASENNTLSFSGNSNFEGNTADFVGGALLVNENNTLSVSGNSSFEGNEASYGGALYASENNTLSFNGTSNFDRNTAAVYGGALVVSKNNNLSFSGNSNFDRNTAAHGGALAATENNTLSFSGNSSFDRNTAAGFGGALVAIEKNTLSISGNNNFGRNRADSGGALYATENNTLSFSGNSNFDRNTADSGGALFATENNNLSFIGHSSFDGNTAGRGGALVVTENNTLIFSGNSNFEGNIGYYYGGALLASENNTLTFSGNSNFDRNTGAFGGALSAWVNNNTFSFNGNSRFEGNRAVYGGALSAYVNNTLSFSGNSRFEGNTAVYGGALSVYEINTLSLSGNSNFEGNTAQRFGGALHSRKENTLSLSGNSTSFSSNTAVFGGAIYAADSIIELTESSTVIGNKATYGGGIFVQGGRITFQGAGSCIENHATQDGYGGAILAINSILRFSGSYPFVGNTAGFGGGISLVGINAGALWLEPGTNLSFNGNAAHKRGGALYVEDNPFTYCIFNTTTENGVRDGCFIQFFDPEQDVCLITGSTPFGNTTGIQFNYSLNFENNTAVQSGDVLYGGDLNFCGVCLARRYTENFLSIQGSTVFGQVTNANMSSQFEISSDPYKVCICENNHPNCNQTTVDVRVYPGHMLSLAIVSVGQMDGVVPSSVIRAVPENLIITSDFKITQPAENNKSCTILRYPLLSEETSASLQLYSEEPCSSSGFPLTVHITFLPCPVGFTLSDQGACICEERLQKYTQGCLLQNLTIRREQGDGFWVGLEDATKPGLILHPHCPFDYCTEEAVDFTLNSTDSQCSPGRSGVLCGGCQSGHSLALGSSRCLSGCSNTFLSLLLAFAAAGIVLVAFLFLCRLTVAEGTLSGLIFYANVLAVNQSIFFPAGTTNVLTVFISWLNLDLGIETCFFVGLDAYSWTWLQFVFPIYIWVLVGLIIYLADVTTTFARIIGRTNPVAVLATLFLLSYTKLLRAIMAAFSFTTLDYPDNESRLVWLYDGNIGYLDKHDGRHIVLFLVSLLVFLFIFLPFTLLLLCGQWIQRKFQLRWLSPTKQLYLKAFLDAYYAPFHDKHRYWTGLLLLLRFFIVLLSTLVNIESPQDPFVSLVVLLCVVSGMLLWSGLTVHKLYKRWYLNILEASFMFNLIVLIGGTYQIRLSGGNQAALVYTSVSIVLTTFIGIVISGIVQQGKKVLQKRRRRRAALQLAVNTEIRDEEEPPQSPAAAPASSVTYSVVEIIRHNSREDDVEMKPLVAVPEENH